MALSFPLTRRAYDAGVRRLLPFVAAVASLAFAGPAAAAEVLLHDNEGRQMRFDVRAEGADAEWFAALLRPAPHGDEISTIRINVVSREELRATCGAEALGCYSRNVMVVPGDQTEETAHTVVHEYGHHIDRARAVAGVPEPNGTSEWWRVRGMEQLYRQKSVERSYVSGWDRSIAEIFAEDYAQLARPNPNDYAIAWLGAPDETVLAALKADFGLGPPPPAVKPPVLRPVTITRNGSLAPKRRVVIQFGLLGPGRRVVAKATFTGAAEKRARARLEVRCGSTSIATRTIGRGKTAVTIDRRDLGPAERCTATLTSSATTSRSYALRVVLSIPTA
jgi:hypothetical protein